MNLQNHTRRFTDDQWRELAELKYDLCLLIDNNFGEIDTETKKALMIELIQGLDNTDIDKARDREITGIVGTFHLRQSLDGIWHNGYTTTSFIYGAQ